MTWVLLSAVAVGVVLIYRAWLGERVGRLQERVRATRATLELQLDRRAHAALSVDGDGPVAQAALVALDAVDADRELAESTLTRALRTAWSVPWPAEARERVLESAERVHLAKQFHSAALSALVRLRRRRAVRLLHVAGERPGGYVEIDDTLPAADEAPVDPT